MKKFLIAALLALISFPALAEMREGGYTPVHYLSAASNNSTLVRGLELQVGSIVAINTTATLYYLKLYDKATAPTCGTDTPVQTYPVPASVTGAGFVVPIPAGGMNFWSGLGFCIVANLVDSDNTNAATGVAVSLTLR